GSSRQRPYCLRHEHVAGCRKPADPRCDVDRAAVHVALLADHIAGVEAEVEGEASVVAGAYASEGALDRLAGAREYGEDSVSEELALDWGPPMVADDGAEGTVEVAGLRPEGGVAEAFGEGCGVGDVGEQNDGSAGHRG